MEQIPEQYKNYDNLIPKGISPDDFWRAISLTDGKYNPYGQKYKADSPYSIKYYYQELEKSGKYKSYVDKIIAETLANLPELLKQVEELKTKRMGPSLEHTNPEEYRRQKEESRLEDEREKRDGKND